ncbi:Tetratricopeptide-like helical domain superfamily [Sesbania bispinosa]|nr:Tetratricopeptide-like helical domain superfamily [Sesbania bispinosa]
MDSLENDGGVQKDDGGDEQCVGEVVVEEVEEEVYQIDEEKLENAVSLLQNSSDGSLESSLDDMGLTLHQDFVIKVFETTPIVLGDNLMRFFKWAWNEKSFKENTPVVESLVVAICSSGLRKKKIYSLWDLVKDIGEKENGVINVGILNELIISCSKLGKGKAALEENETVQLALEMLNDIPGEKRKHAIKPFLAVVRALYGPPPGNDVFNFVITAYSKVGEMGQAVEMMKLLESRGLKPDVYTYVVIASGYSNGGEMEEARKILEEAKKKHVKLSPVLYHTLIRGYCKIEQFDEALKLLTEMKDYGVRSSFDDYDKLIQSLCLKALDWEAAEKLQEETKEND